MIDLGKYPEGGDRGKTMSAAELIVILQAVPPETPVMGYWEGMDWKLQDTDICQQSAQCPMLFVSLNVDSA